MQKQTIELFTITRKTSYGVSVAKIAYLCAPMTTSEHYTAPEVEIFEAIFEQAVLLDASPYIQSGEDNEWGNY